jgi:hypothetical protein
MHTVTGHRWKCYIAQQIQFVVMHRNFIHIGGPNPILAVVHHSSPLIPLHRIGSTHGSPAQSCRYRAPMLGVWMGVARVVALPLLLVRLEYPGAEQRGRRCV